MGSNLLTFRVPIFVMNLDSVPTGVTRDVAYVLTLGDSKLWTGIHSILLSPYVAPPAGAAVTITSVRDVHCSMGERHEISKNKMAKIIVYLG